MLDAAAIADRVVTSARRCPVALRAAIAILPLTVLPIGCRTPVSLDPAPPGEQVRLAQRSLVTSDELSQATINVLELEGLPPRVTPEAAERLAALASVRADPTTLVALAEVSYGLARRPGGIGAWDNLTVAALASWTALFRADAHPSRFGARWELARVIHNASLAQALTFLDALPGAAAMQFETVVAGDPMTIDYRWVGPQWTAASFVRFLPADDFRVRGMRNRHRASGIGAAILGERVSDPAIEVSPGEDFLPPRSQTVALSAVISDVRFTAGQPWPPAGFSVRIVDPNWTESTTIATVEVPLEADFTAALASTLAGQRPLHRAGLGGLRNAAGWQDLMGLYMLEPFDPNRIPVVFIHGLVSSPIVWREMANDLWGDPEIRRHYQFWFFLYPTGQPFLVSALELRRSLDRVLDRLDPDRSLATLARMVLVGHSMGGLLARRLIIEPGDALWNAVSDVSFDDAILEEDDRTMLRELFFAGPQEGVASAIFMAVPLRGSRLADASLGRLGARLIQLPPALLEFGARIFYSNPDQLRFGTSRHPIATGIDTLSPRSPFLAAFAKQPASAGVRTHTIIGRRSGPAEPGGTDGVVPYESAHMADADSELVISNANHSVPLNPAAIVEVRRILYEHVGIAGP